MVHPKVPQSAGKQSFRFTCGQQFTSITQLCQSQCNSRAELTPKIDDMCPMQRNYGARHPFREKQICQRHGTIYDSKGLVFWCLKAQQKHSQLPWSDKQARRKKDAQNERICSNRQSTALKRHCVMVTRFSQDKLYGQERTNSLG